MKAYHISVAVSTSKLLVVDCLLIGTGSIAVYPYNNKSYTPMELGASIFVSVNKNLWRATDEFNLTRYTFEEGDGSMGVWDGENLRYSVGHFIW